MPVTPNRQRTCRKVFSAPLRENNYAGAHLPATDTRTGNPLPATNMQKGFLCAPAPLREEGNAGNPKPATNMQKGFLCAPAPLRDDIPAGNPLPAADTRNDFSLRPGVRKA